MDLLGVISQGSRNCSAIALMSRRPDRLVRGSNGYCKAQANELAHPLANSLWSEFS